MGNNFIEASYKCNPVEKKILNLAILKANRREFPEKPNPLLTYVVKVSRKDLLDVAGLDTDKDFRHILKACKSLNEKVLIFVDENGKEFKTSSFITESGLKGGELKLGFYGRVVPFFNKLKKRFTSYDLLQTKQFTGKYTIRFYEFIKQYENIGKRDMKIETLRKMFQLEDKYKNFTDFKRRVLDSAQTELKEKSELYFDYKQNKTGRNITSITLTIKLNPKHIDKKYYLKRVNDYLANQSVSDFYDDLKKYYHEHQENFSISEKQSINNFIIKKPDPKTLSESLLYHFFQWYEPDLGL